MSRNNYFEHDSRGDRPMGRNRKYGGPRNGPRGYGPPPNRPRFQDQEDVVMSGTAVAGGSWGGNERRYVPYKFGKNSTKRRRDKKGRNKQGPNDIDHSDGTWFKISVPFGRKLGKQFILRSLHSNCKMPFVPFDFHFDANCAIFYVNDGDIAMNIKDVNLRITTPDGFKMKVFMCRSGPPVCAMNEEASNIIKKRMSDRYDVAAHALNLQKFHHDPELQQQGLYVPLNKPNVVNAVVRIIKEHIPEIESLDVSDNNLVSLEAFSSLVPVCGQLISLTLQNNKLKNMSELNHIKGMNIISLILDGNLLCGDFKEKTSYVSSIRDRLPKLMKLDGCDLPAPIGFDLGAESIPASKGSFFIADDVKALCVQFLEQYYTIYDSEDRGKLLDAYHDQANFSLTTCKMNQRPNQTSTQHYVPESRNLLRITESNYRCKLLKQGRLAVVSALTQLPPTQHDPNSFAVDIFHVSPGLMTFSVTGVFKEGGHETNNQPLITFHRTFVVAAQGPGFVIVSEMLFLTNATNEQIKAFKFPAPTPSPSPAPAAIGSEKSPEEKQQLAVELAKATGMNIDFSAKCLDENDWDYQKAFIVFSELNVLGKIPPEAFMNLT